VMVHAAQEDGIAACRRQIRGRIVGVNDHDVFKVGGRRLGADVGDGPTMSER
jgi:hypothetical protein